jgi:hypothetical protein
MHSSLALSCWQAVRAIIQWDVAVYSHGHGVSFRSSGSGLLPLSLNLGRRPCKGRNQRPRCRFVTLSCVSHQDSFALDAVFEESSTSWFWKLFGASGKKEEKTTTMTIPKFPTAMGQVNLATSLQYGAATGIVQLQAIFKEFSTKVYQPAYDDFATLIHTGNTDAYVNVRAV